MPVFLSEDAERTLDDLASLLGTDREGALEVALTIIITVIMW